jgi:GTPase SAR1 family protein
MTMQKRQNTINADGRINMANLDPENRSGDSYSFLLTGDSGLGKTSMIPPFAGDQPRPTIAPVLDLQASTSESFKDLASRILRELKVSSQYRRRHEFKWASRPSHRKCAPRRHKA